MPDYKEMYLTLFRATEEALRVLIDAQRACEELYLSAPEPELMPETPEMALWDAKYGTVTYVPKNTD